MPEVKPTDEKESKPTDGAKGEQEYKDALMRFSKITGSELDRDNREQSNEDVRFANEVGGMWDDYSRRNWEGRPKYEVNQIQPMINVVVSQQRESDFTSKVIPLGGGATKKTADVLNGLVRSINVQSNFDDARDNAFRESATCGFGGWYITTEWNEADPWVQDIVVKTIRSGINSIYFDPASIKECNEDANYCFVCEWISQEDFKKRYPDATESDMPIDNDASFSDQWYNEDKVRIADYWCKKEVKKTIGLFRRTDFQTGQTEEKTWEIGGENKKIVDEALNDGWELVKEREMSSYKITHRKMCGSAFLSGENDWAGLNIPVVPVYGYQTWLDGARRYWGMVRFAKDSQRIYNYAWSGTIHAMAKAPKDPYWLTRKQVSNQKDAQAIKNMAVNDDPAYFYTPDPDAPGTPQRSGGPQFPNAFMGVLSEATQNVQRATGKFASSQGDNPMDQSGRAVLALQKQGDLGTFSLNDNLSKSIRRHTEILIDLIPRIFDTSRQLRITKADGSSQIVETLPEGGERVNTQFEDGQTGETVLLVDLNQGRYDVAEEIGASYSSRRQEALAALTEMAHNNPTLSMLVMDEVIKMMDFNGTDEAIKRVQKWMTNQGLREPTPDEIMEAQKKQQEMGPQQPSPQEQMQMESAKMALEKQALENDKMELENKKLELEMMLKRQEAASNAADTEETLAKTDKLEAEAGKIRVETAQGGKLST